MKKKRETKGWSPERRRKQAELCRAAAPWEKSTGPRTAAGKAACANNGLKHGAYTAEILTLRHALTRHRLYLRGLMARHQNENMHDV
jgi:hypothetical protein